MDTDTDRPPTGFDSELSIMGVTATTWSLLAPLIWTGTKGDTFVVPLDFRTDFATVPRFLHWLVSPYGPYTRAAVLHDWLLVELAEHHARWEGRKADGVGPGSAFHDEPPANSRDADGIFRRVMQDLGTAWAKRWVMWTAVRWAALFNARRAYGRAFARDLPRVLGISLVAIPVVLPGAVGVLLSLGIARLFGGRKSVPPIRGGQRGRTARNGISDRS